MQLSPASTPSAIRCRVATTTTLIDVDGIPGAAAAVVELQHHGLRARFKPLSDGDHRIPYAFVALGVAVHAAWFDSDRYVADYERTACGKRFHTLREPLLARAAAPSTSGPCPDCLAAWQARYA